MHKASPERQAREADQQQHRAHQRRRRNLPRQPHQAPTAAAETEQPKPSTNCRADHGGQDHQRRGILPKLHKTPSPYNRNSTHRSSPAPEQESSPSRSRKTCRGSQGAPVPSAAAAHILPNLHPQKESTTPTAPRRPFPPRSAAAEGEDGTPRTNPPSILNPEAVTSAAERPRASCREATRDDSGSRAAHDTTDGESATESRTRYEASNSPNPYHPPSHSTREANATKAATTAEAVPSAAAEGEDRTPRRADPAAIPAAPTEAEPTPEAANRSSDSGTS